MPFSQGLVDSRRPGAFIKGTTPGQDHQFQQAVGSFLVAKRGLTAAEEFLEFSDVSFGCRVRVRPGWAGSGQLLCNELMLGNPADSAVEPGRCRGASQGANAGLEILPLHTTGRKRR